VGKQRKGAGSSTRVAPKLRLKGPPILADRLVFSPDGKVLLASWEVLDTHAWDLASGKSLMSESFGDALTDLSKIAGDVQKRLESASPEVTDGGFAGSIPAAMGTEAAPGGMHTLTDPMNVEVGGPTLTAEGEAYVKGLNGPTGLEALDLAAGLIRKPGPVIRVLSPDGRRYVAIHENAGNRIEFYEAKSGKRLGQAAGKVRSGSSPLAFSPDGSYLAGEVEAGKTAVWSVPDGKHMRTMKGHGDELSALAFSPDAKWLATAGDDGCVGLWEPFGGELKGWLVGWEGQVASLAFARAGGRDLLLVAETESIGLFRVPELIPVARVPRATIGSKDWEIEAAGASVDGKLVAISVGGGRVNVFETEELVKVGMMVADDSVKQETLPLGKDKQPKESLRTGAAAEFEALAREHAAKNRSHELEAAFTGIFSKLPKKFEHVLFELDLSVAFGQERGLYWAAQGKNATTLVAYELKRFKNVLLPPEALEDAKYRSAKGQLWDIHRDVMVEFVAALWQELAPPDVRGLLMVSMEWEKRVYDLRERVWKDYMKTLYPDL
jgi:hypothetical protein